VIEPSSDVLRYFRASLGRQAAPRI